MGYSFIIHSPLIENHDELEGWKKDTVEYATQNKGKVYAKIRGIAKNIHGKRLQSWEVDDIYSDVMMYMFKTDDYDTERAIVGDGIVSFESFISICIKYCVIRYCTNVWNERHNVVSNVVTTEDGELDLLDTVPNRMNMYDEDAIMYDLAKLCESYEPYRYIRGIDIYQIWLIKILIMKYKKDSKYAQLLKILNINNGMSNSDIGEDSIMANLAKAINLAGTEKSIEILKNYVFGQESIERAIINM